MNTNSINQASEIFYMHPESLSSLTNSDTSIATPYYPQCCNNEFEIYPVPSNVEYEYIQTFMSALECSQFTSPLLKQCHNYNTCNNIYDNVIPKLQTPIIDSDIFNSTNQLFNQWPVNNFLYQPIYQRHESPISPNFQPIEDQGINSQNECYKQKIYDQDRAYSIQADDFNKVPFDDSVNCSGIPILWSTYYISEAGHVPSTPAIKEIPPIFQSTPKSQAERDCSIEQPAFMYNRNYPIQLTHNIPFSVKAPTKPLVKEFKCDKCEKVFHRKSSLKVHAITHSGLKPYKCTYPRCSKKFSVLSNQRRHLRLHRKKLIDLQEINNRDSLQIDIFRQTIPAYNIEFLENDPSLLNTNYRRIANQYQRTVFNPSQSRSANMNF